MSMDSTRPSALAAGTDAGLRGPRVTTGVRANTLTLGGDLSLDDDLRSSLHQYQNTYDNNRSLYSALGYLEDPEYEHFKARYERGGTATAIVDKPPADCWGEVPEIVDEASDEVDGQTDFEEAVEELLNGDWTRVKPTKRFQAADEECRLGQFSLILLGFDDANVSDGNPESLSKEVDTESLNDDESDGLQYMSVFSQAQVDWEETTFVEDATDSRFNLPKTYHVDLGEPVGEVDIHHERILHVVEGQGRNELRSPSVLRRSINRLDDLEKILGASAEGYWRAAYQAIVWHPPTDADGRPISFNDGSGPDSIGGEGSKLEQQIEEYRHNLRRQVFTAADFETIGADVEQPLDHAEAQYREIAAGHDYPMSVLMGNETGERATQEDRQMWNESMARRQRQHCEPAILAPWIDRLIRFNVLPEPRGGTFAYTVEHPPLEEPSEQEEAETALTWMKAFNKGTGGQPDMLATEAERRKKMGMAPARGSEVDEDQLPEGQQHQQPPESQQTAADGEDGDQQPSNGDDITVNESDPAVQAQFERSQGDVEHGYWLRLDPDTATDGVRVNVDRDSERFRRARDVVENRINMTAEDLRQLEQTQCGQDYQAMTRGDPFAATARVIRLLETPPERWTSEHVDDALRVKQFHDRHSSLDQQGHDRMVSEDCQLAPLTMAQVCWGVDPTPTGRFRLTGSEEA